MLTISLLKSGFEQSPIKIYWTVSEHLDGKVMETWEENGYAVSQVQADGDELAWLLQTYNNIPSAFHMQIQKWRGSDAQFIFDHLPRTWK